MPPHVQNENGTHDHFASDSQTQIRQQELPHQRHTLKEKPQKQSLHWSRHLKLLSSQNQQMATSVRNLFEIIHGKRSSTEKLKINVLQQKELQKGH